MLSNNAITIQKYYRGYKTRYARLPLILYQIQNHLVNTNISFFKNNDDGRINSCMDEMEIISVLRTKFNKRIQIPKCRMWYDILAHDNLYGWIPINIKTTTTKTSDNTGNLAMCVQAYTDTVLDLQKSYENGKMSELLFTKLNEKKYNRNAKKDYYFIVLNKNNSQDVIINSVKGLTILTPNINNLPFQVCWDKNRIPHYDIIDKKVEEFIECLQRPKPSWKETFMSNIRSL